ncbi:ectonucleotide pyrophosphatase/phosphodiesterase [Opitutus sp. ER46]|uniref:alkaline phosphatase family protein n=1 Tax=Opitutus sp. ER46 TaxID=2161864 RepID=UPI001304B4E1|nr:ectonucleotide pyrophosphatase/phosphodiesterase [Opitutus sp. ER46]
MNLFRPLAGLMALAALTGTLAAATPPRAVLLISLDGLRPDYILQADQHGLKIPHLRALARTGTYATGVRGVLPTSTYPSHASLITGTAPATHGIVNNHPFGREVPGLDLWYYYAWDLKVPTLWDVAAAAGYRVANVSWPVTVGATAIHANIPEFALSRSDEDLNLTRGAATPGLVAELAGKAGPYITDNHDAVPRDWARTRYGVELIRQKQARFLGVHLAATDHFQHRNGPFAPVVCAALEEIDTMVGQLVAAMREIDPRAVVCVVSDHGFAPVDNQLFLDAAFVKAGFVTLKAPAKTIEDGQVKEWIARPWTNSGSAAIVLKDPRDAAARARVAEFLARLAADPANGIAAILDEATLRRMGGAPNAQFWVDLKPGYGLSAVLGDKTVAPVSRRGTHGHAPLHPELYSTFVIAGDGITAGRDLGIIDIRSIAPTLARLMGTTMPTAEAPAIDLSLSTR